jgi:5-methylthioadenosine/S-adenosylhomocysteine deaminase
MARIDTIIKARWVIPVVPEGQVLEDHALLISGDRIDAIIPSSELPTDAGAERLVDLPGHALIPGLVNAHTHAPMSLLRGLADDLPLMTWLREHIWPAEARWVDRSFVADGTRLAIAEMLRCGTTCFNDMYYFPDVTASISVASGMRAAIGMIVLDHATVWAQSADQYIDNGLAVQQDFQGEALITPVWAPHAPYTVSDEPWRRIRALADRYGHRVHTHLHESRLEIEQAMRDHGNRPYARLSDLGLDNERLVAVHMTQLKPAEIDQLATAGVHVVHCPESNLKLASGFAPLARLDAAGVNCALGTDGAASNNDLDMIGEMKTAALLAKGVSADASAIPAARILTIATMGGARALGLENVVGSLEIGKAADLVAVDLNATETLPVYNPVSQLVYASCRQQVTDVWVAGRRLLENKMLTTLDTTQIGERARWWRDRIVAE